MILYPAIDLKEGAAVRLKQGRMAGATVYAEDPAAQAKAFEAAGATHLHLVDLDGAVAGRSVNEAAVRAILAGVRMEVQLGGGMRDLAAIEHWLEAGVARVVLGTAAARDPVLLAEACRRFPGRIAVAIDAHEGKLRSAGWTEEEPLSPPDLARRAEQAGAAALIHTDIGRDGMLSGANVEATAALAQRVKLPVILSGGVASLDDLRAAKAVGLAGAILGRALYEGRIDLREALAQC
ncbi:MAG TPA: 1-(5-phosphoribosyl)-5-[(5-phosphoribosylamino)methylideneamino]imidazole-4-carboxamide isomerase [Methylomirabilota bacterium]|jgi:phosphoribosylformimino-5-aminoimidazole carboxamide ribotide isomerase|nr:1-(5-phosphoribosyl)-5-[(5-phosphoribosylamino)methylideneamino]imidazole-4-carboxamide isomerase [Methylomirabilota bacterium]